METFQSNHEGALLDHLHRRLDALDGCVLNPAALTQYGVGLHDCIKSLPFPVIEVHLSNIQSRELWRRHSIVGEAARGSVMGLGWRSYTAALRALVELVREESAGARRRRRGRREDVQPVEAGAAARRCPVASTPPA